ncbi:hypothetical protein [Rhodococcus qingshengii]|uniref:hypothetical protein n=1 Tax=Rhodococcus qingshengii TaxID=334542 RepID=UPI0035D891E2
MVLVAIINIPGYLAMDDDLPRFNDAKEAWQYLADERERGFDGIEDQMTDEDVWHYLVAQAEEPTGDGTGSCHGSTPGYTGDHDLGLCYSVQVTEDECVNGSPSCTSDDPCVICYDA